MWEGWWKMAIFHFKRSHLNWRVIPCKRRNDLCFCNFSSFCFFLDCCLGLIKFFKCMTWQSIFLFSFFFFFCSHDSSTPGNDACHRWPSRLKHHSSCENCFEKGSSFGSSVVHVIFVQRKGMAQKGFWEMGNFFSQCALKHQSKLF